MDSEGGEPGRISGPAWFAILLGIVLLAVTVRNGALEVVGFFFAAVTIVAGALLVLGRLVTRRAPFSKPSALFWIVVEVLAGLLSILLVTAGGLVPN